MNLDFMIIGAVVLFLFFIVWKLSRQKKLSQKIIIQYSAKIRKTASLDPAHSIMESHKIFTAALSFLFKNKKLTAAQKIAKIQKKLPNIAKIWQHHGFRNKIAHETDVRVPKAQAASARQDFIKALESLG